MFFILSVPKSDTLKEKGTDSFFSSSRHHESTRKLYHRVTVHRFQLTYCHKKTRQCKETDSVT